MDIRISVDLASCTGKKNEKIVAAKKSAADAQQKTGVKSLKIYRMGIEPGSVAFEGELSEPTLPNF